MANRIVERIMHGPKERPDAPLGGTRAESIQRLQVGIAGIVVMILLVALADLVRESADQTEAANIPQAVATAPAEGAAAPTDPMVEAGVVPDLPANPDELPAQDEPVLPEVGAAKPAAGAAP